MAPARARRAVRRRRARSAPHACSRRPEACSPSWSPGPTSRSCCRRSAARRSISLAMSSGSPSPDTVIACRVHDECNGSDVFGSDICTCRPYLVHGDRGLRRDRAAGRGRDRRLQPQGGASARRGHQVPRLQRPQATAGRRPRRHLFPPHRMRRRRAGHALSGADAGCLPLARHPPHRPLGVDVEREARRAARRRGSRSSSRSRSRIGWCRSTRQVEIAAKKAAGYFAPSGIAGSAASCAAPKAVPSTT